MLPHPPGSRLTFGHLMPGYNPVPRLPFGHLLFNYNPVPRLPIGHFLPQNTLLLALVRERIR
jgi:hypothetical protein